MKEVRHAQGLRGGLWGDAAVVLRIQEEKPGIGLGQSGEGRPGVRATGPLRNQGSGTWRPGPAHIPGHPSTEQRGKDESVGPGPAPCLLPGARLLVCLHLPSSVKVSRRVPDLHPNLSFSWEILLHLHPRDARRVP